MNSTQADDRFFHIDDLVAAAGHRLNTATMRFERLNLREAVGPDRFDCSAEAFRKTHLPGIEKEELWEYMRWKRAQLDGRFPVVAHAVFAEPAEA